MVFDIDPDRPTIPGIARILSLLALLSLIGSIVLMLVAFSRFAWVNPIYAVWGALAALILAVIMAGQAKTLELLSVVGARVKSRFAIEHAFIPQAAAQPAPAERKLPVAAPVHKDRVISIPEEMAREQGLTRHPEPRDFG